MRRKLDNDYPNRPDKYKGPDHRHFLTLNAPFAGHNELRGNTYRYYYCYRDALPPRLISYDFDFITCIGVGSHSRTILAKHIVDNKMCCIKIPNNDNNSDEGRERFFQETMMHHAAYTALEHYQNPYYGKVPKQYGFLMMWIQATPTTPEKVLHCLVSEFIRVLPEENDTLTLGQAMADNHKYDFFTLEEWRDIFIRLIQTVEIFRQNDIYHLDLTDENILLRFHGGSTDHAEPVIIDFGNARKKTDRWIPPHIPVESPIHEGKDYAQHVPPEHFTVHEPSDTADLYGISHLLQKLCRTLGNLPTLEAYIKRFRRQAAHDRDGFNLFREYVRASFEKDIALASGADVSLPSIEPYPRPPSPKSVPSGAATKPPSPAATKPPSPGLSHAVSGLSVAPGGSAGTSASTQRDLFNYIYRGRETLGYAPNKPPPLYREHVRLAFDTDIGRARPSYSSAPSSAAASMQPHAESAHKPPSKRIRFDEGASGRSSGASGRSSGATGRSSGASDRPSDASGRSSGATGRSSGASGKRCSVCARLSAAPAAPSGAPAGPSGAPAGPSGAPAGPSGAPAVPSGRLVVKHCRTCAALQAASAGPSGSSTRPRSMSDRLNDAFMVPDDAAAARSRRRSDRPRRKSDNLNDAFLQEKKKR